jgi:hypothetical protein
MRAFGGEPFGYRQPDADARASDNGDLIAQPKVHLITSFTGAGGVRRFTIDPSVELLGRGTQQDENTPIVDAVLD